jgi:hypothetical protein
MQLQRMQDSVDDDGVLVILKLAVFLDPDAATDPCFRLLGHVARVKKVQVP